MTSKDLLNIVKNYYGYKAKRVHLEKIKDDLEVCALLYESFTIKCSVSNYHNEFGAGILLGNGEQVLAGEILGQKLAMSANENLIINSLKIIDNYCCLRLPDKFLEAYDNAYKKKNEYQN